MNNPNILWHQSDTGWATGLVSGLRVRGGFEVDIVWKAEKSEEALDASR